MPPKSAKVLDSIGTPPYQGGKTTKARTTSNSRQTLEYAPVMQPRSTPLTPVDSPVSSSPVRKRRASIEEEPDADQPSGPPRPLTPGRPIIDLNDPPYDETVLARSSKEAVAARGSKSKSANSAATSDSFTRTEGALVTDHTHIQSSSQATSFPSSGISSAAPSLNSLFTPSESDSSKRTLNANALWFTPSGAEQPFLEKDKPAMYSKAVSIFQGISVMDRFKLFDEPLHVSISRYYPPWDEWNDEDPLADYGAVDGHLPQGRPDEEALLLREVLIRWSHPDHLCLLTSCMKPSSLITVLAAQLNTMLNTMHPLLDTVHNLLIAVVRVIQKRKILQNKISTACLSLSFSGSFVKTLTLIYIS
ncbi:hypothetical protein BJ912DRAFT_931803 [Pholiota molesta]|nr:hypothetical protein BJ912DRAFT_931803 [Pholiota molesta]